MEYYAALYHGDKKQQYQNNIQVGAEESETIDGNDGYMFEMANVPTIFIAYTCWAWDFYGKTFTNLLFKINPYRQWHARPTMRAHPSDPGKQQFDFYMQAFQKRMVNKDIKYQKTSSI